MREEGEALLVTKQDSFKFKLIYFGQSVRKRGVTLWWITKQDSTPIFPYMFLFVYDYKHSENFLRFIYYFLLNFIWICFRSHLPYFIKYGGVDVMKNFVIFM